MNSRDLLYFNKLVETKSYTQTAIFFGISQPSISAAIKRLSHEFKTDLFFQRFPRDKLIITPAGRILYNRSNEILKLLKVTHNEVFRANEIKLHIGISPVVGKTFLPSVLQTLSKNNLLKSLETTEAGSKKLLDELEDGQIDAGLINLLSPLNNSKFTSQVLRINSVKLIVSNKNQLAKYDKIEFNKLSSERFITMNHQFIHRTIFNIYCSNAHIKPPISYLTDNISILLELVRKNLGIALVTDKAAEGIDNIKAIELINGAEIKTYTLLVLCSDFRLTQKQREVVNAIKQI